MTELQTLPIDSSITETIKILKAENKAVKMLAELKGCKSYSKSIYPYKCSCTSGIKRQF